MFRGLGWGDIHFWHPIFLGILVSVTLSNTRHNLHPHLRLSFLHTLTIRSAHTQMGHKAFYKNLITLFFSFGKVIYWFVRNTKESKNMKLPLMTKNLNFRHRFHTLSWVSARFQHTLLKLTKKQNKNGIG